MNKILLTGTILIISLFGFNSVKAQDITFGAKAGPTFSIYTLSEGDDFPEGEELGDSENGIGFHLGVYGALPVGEKSEILVEALFQARNLQAEESYTILGFTTTMEITQNLNYLSIPVMYGYLFNDNFHVHIGPQFNVFLGGKMEADGLGEVSGDDFNDNFKTFELGLGIGAVYNLDMGLNFGLRYSRGLTDIQEENDMDFTNINSNLIEFSIGYNIITF